MRMKVSKFAANVEGSGGLRKIAIMLDNVGTNAMRYALCANIK